ncbi:hybrid sensor histidine kinase/response regulator [Wenyingzhuangia marina]|uniref:histidine kinase n=1 Tax=Wenyingzhuangia marina TaxID=1195760 RepID=A0A1M5U196_9FLAO|nr:ATP-binding protein [Wenyingzhuangia marina]GGF70124.1 hybrid sensor histidine kinase/response regulator [Wenyingzhuangia marina]SHH56640.1 Signal transduction histidine kinase [Wenyingzhuangia marina]
MKSPKHSITFKILSGYIILGVLATIAGILIISEIDNFTKIQKQDISDRSKIIKVGSLIASIYENENLSRAAIQLNSSKKIKEYNDENKQLSIKIDSLNFIVNNDFQKNILDSIRLIIDHKLKNIIAVKKLKRNNNSEKSIDTVISKLSSMDSILESQSAANFDKMFITDFVENIDFYDKKTPSNLYLKDYVKMLNKLNPDEKDVTKYNKDQIDSLLMISRTILSEAQKDIENKRRSIERKERDLIEKDILISKKLRELLQTLEKDIIKSTKTINQERENSLNKSKRIILFAAGFSFVVIFIFSIIFLNDFWKNERYRKELEEANKTSSALLKSRSQIISMVSHDLRTPLSTISGYSELLLKAIKNTKEANYIGHINNASAYMQRLVNDLLEFSNIENNKISITSVPFDLKNLMHEIINHSQNLIQQKPIRFVIDFDEKLNHLIISDPYRIKQVLYNLVANACKFTEQGTITLKSVLDKEKKMLYLSVTDTGIGIDKEEQQDIFKAFTQVKNTDTNHHQNGFGLGLTISKRLSELLGGNLVLSSELGVGSTFVFSFPMVLSNESIKNEKSLSTQINFDITVVVVEDDASMQQLLKDLFSQYGVELYVFENAQKALNAINDISFDMVLTDIQLPKMNGIHFMEVLKNHDRYKNQPIVAMTGRSNLSIKDYLENGFSEVLIKPFTIHQLETVLLKFFKGTNILKEQQSKSNVLNTPNGFSIKTLRVFLNDDEQAIKQTLSVFLKDTQNNKILLKKAIEANNLKDVNELSHKMLTMFKQLEVQTVIPFLEMLETAEFTDQEIFIAFEKELNKFINSLENYLN